MMDAPVDGRVMEELRKEQVRQSGRYAISPPPALAPAPVALEDGERLLEYRKPRMFAYTPLLFGTLFGLVLFVLFLLSGNIAAILLGAAIWAGLFWFLRERYWRRAGCWFTDQRLIIDDGSRVHMIPYGEVALSSLALEADGLLFSTVYGKEFILRGLGNPAMLAGFLMRMGREAGPRFPVRPPPGRPSS
jgi:hypothetical protein